LVDSLFVNIRTANPNKTHGSVDERDWCTFVLC